MKKIRNPTISTVKIPPGCQVRVSQALALTQEARENKGRIIEGALAVEHHLNDLIGHYFFGGGKENAEKKAIFRAVVLDSDWCPFSAKRRLVGHIIEAERLLTGKAKNDFDNLIRKVMALRNAAAHGSLTTDAHTVWLSYFEGTPRTKELSDDYLTEIEGLLNAAVREIVSLLGKAGAPPPADVQHPPAS